MRKFLFSVLFISFSATIFSQNTLPSISLKNMDGSVMNTATINSEKPVIISFWATWCVPCIEELDTIAEEYEDWNEETGVTLIAVSVDDPRSQSRVKPMVNGKAWDYTVLLDTKQELKRALNVSSVPHVFIVYKGKIVYNHTGYTEGSEQILYEKVQELVE